MKVKAFNKRVFYASYASGSGQLVGAIVTVDMVHQYCVSYCML